MRWDGGVHPLPHGSLHDLQICTGAAWPLQPWTRYSGIRQMFLKCANSNE